MSITAIVENGIIKLPVPVPDGTRVEVLLPAENAEANTGSGNSFLDTMQEVIGSVDGPVDWAAEHDHYAHGTPKREMK